MDLLQESRKASDTIAKMLSTLDIEGDTLQARVVKCAAPSGMLLNDLNYEAEIVLRDGTGRVFANDIDDILVAAFRKAGFLTGPWRNSNFGSSGKGRVCKKADIRHGDYLVNTLVSWWISDIRVVFYWRPA